MAVAITVFVIFARFGFADTLDGQLICGLEEHIHTHGYVIRYQLKFKEGEEEKLTGPIELKNTAGFTGNSETHQGTFTSDSKIKYGKKPIEKDMADLNGQAAAFDIAVNPYAVKIDGGSNLLVTDRMNNTLAFYLTSIEAYVEQSEQKKSGNFTVSKELMQTAELDPGIQGQSY